MKCSIGGYNLVEFTENGNGTYSTYLYKNDIKVAKVENLGDDFINITFEPIPEGGAPDHYKFILHDLFELSFQLAPIMKEDGAFKSFLLSHYSAVIGFVELLKDFNGLVARYDEIPNKNSAVYYIVGSFGSSWFTKEDISHDKKHFWKYANTNDYAEAEKILKTFEESRKELDGRLVAGAILAGDMDWNLTFEDYGELYNP